MNQQHNHTYDKPKAVTFPIILLSLRFGFYLVRQSACWARIIQNIPFVFQSGCKYNIE